MKQPGSGKVSIVIPCYNHGPFLREALASVEKARNAYLAEVIVVDDGSNETETCQFFDELESSGYVILRQENQGLAKARNNGIRLAQSEFVLPLDSDNLLRDSYLNRGTGLLIDHPEIDVVYSDSNYFGEKEGRHDVPEFDLSLLLEGNFIDACALFRKRLWEEIGGYDQQMPWPGWEDWDFWLRAMFAGARFEHLPEIGFDYRCRKGSMLSTTNLHAKELTDYIFSKKEMLVSARLLRESILQARDLRDRCAHLEKSATSRLAAFVKAVLHMDRPARK